MLASGYFVLRHNSLSVIHTSNRAAQSSASRTTSRCVFLSTLTVSRLFSSLIPVPSSPSSNDPRRNSSSQRSPLNPPIRLPLARLIHRPVDLFHPAAVNFLVFVR